MQAATNAERLLLLEEKVQLQERISADVEMRLRKIEMAIYFATGGLAALQVILKFL